MNWINAMEAAKRLNHKNIGRTNLLLIVKIEALTNKKEFEMYFKWASKKHRIGMGYKKESSVLLFNELLFDFVREYIISKYPNGYTKTKIEKLWDR